MTVRKQPLRDRLRDGALPRSSEPIQPVDGAPIEVSCPKFDPIQNGSACPFETTFALAMSILGPTCTAEVIEDRLFGYKSFISDTCRPKRRMF